MAAVRLSNDGASGLPPGVLTLYEPDRSGSSFVGDAQLSPLPAGEQRLVSYALDQKALVDREIKDLQTIAKGRIVNGVFELTYAQERRTSYAIKAPAREPRILLLEHPRQPGWKLEQPMAKEVELAKDSFRITQAVRAGESTQFDVVLSKPTMQRIGLVNLNSAQLSAYSTNSELDSALRKAFAKLAELRAVLDARERGQQELQRERSQLHEEQKRIRDNLARVPRDSDLHKRYLKKLDRQEDKLESVLAQAQTLRERIADAHKALVSFIQGLDL
ncbi:MAG: hypothetical protein ACI8W7_002514 [Gammaproteobacteria bacterium]